MTNSISAQEKPTLIYVGDPMCSWCYGFSNEFSTSIESLGESINLEIVMGGLRPYNKESMTDLKSFLVEHWEDVHKASNQPFSYDILNKADIMYDTEPSCRAVVTMRKLKPESELAFFKAVQKGFYVENKHPILTETYAALAATFGVDKKEFADLFESELMKVAVKQDFQLAQSLNARSFPTVILQHEDQYYLVAQGYVKADDLLTRIKSVLK